MNIDELVKKYLDRNGWRTAKALRAALTEQACLHHIELRAYEATVQNLEQRIRELEKERDELRKDAARYQFIRALENDAVAIQLVKSECDVDLDAAIDAAIAAEETGNG